MADEKDYEVGYGKPPKRTRFKKGQSGNPKGRPKKTKDLEKLFDLELSQTLQIRERGQMRTITKRQAIVKGLVHSALQGDHRALKLVVGFMKSHHDIDGFEPDVADREALADLLEQFKLTEGDSNG